MRHPGGLAAVLLCAALLSACQSDSEAPSVARVDQLSERAWVPSPVYADGKVGDTILVFSRSDEKGWSGRVTGYDGCNAKSGLFRESDDLFKAEITQSTMKACTHESAIDLLEEAADFDIDDKKLVFLGAAGDVVVSFTRIDHGVD